MACYLLTQVDAYDYGMELVDLAAIGTIADVAPLIGENRSIVKRALKRMRNCWYNREGVKALYDGDITRITAEDIAFRLAPCINAPGRLEYRDADLPLLLFFEDNPEIAKYLAGRVVQYNEKRKQIQKEWSAKMEEQAEKYVQEGDRVLVFLADEAPSGIAGLIAGSLKEKYNRPVIVFAPKGDRMGGVVWTGSGRSIEGFHLLNALIKCEDLFLSYGGHKLAAGMSICTDKNILDELCKRLNREAEYLTDDDLTPVVYWDMAITENNLTKELYDEMKALEPFGEGVRKPVFKMKLHTAPKRHMVMGADKRHLKLFCESYSAVGFSLVSKYIQAELPGVIEGLGYPFENCFNGKITHEFMLIDFEPITVQCELRPCKEIDE